MWPFNIQEQTARASAQIKEFRLNLGLAEIYKEFGFTAKGMLKMKYILDSIGYTSSDEDIERFASDLFNKRIKTPKELAIAYHEKKIKELQTDSRT